MKITVEYDIHNCEDCPHLTLMCEILPASKVGDG